MPNVGPLPGISITILSNGLGQLPPSSANTCAKMGICSVGLPATIYQEGDTMTAQADLGVGPLAEATVDSLSVAGGSVIAVPLTPSTAGSVGTVNTTKVTGAGTLTPSAAPAVVITAKIITGGALGTMTAQFSVNGGAYGATQTSTITSWAYLVPGTLTTLTFSAQTYTAAAVWTVSTVGVITIVGTGTAGWVTQVSSPLDAFSVVATIVTGGALGAGIFTYSVDGGNNTSGQILLPSGGAYAIPGTGVVLTWSAATYTIGDIFSFTTTGASFGTSDVSAALAVLLADPREWAFCQVVGQGVTAASSASMAAVIDTQMFIAEAAFRWVFGMVECPTQEVDATISAAFTSFVSTRTMVTAGDIGHISSITPGRVIRRNCGTVVASRIALCKPKEHPGKFKLGALKNVKSLYQNFGATTWNPITLDGARFTTLRTIPKATGYFVTRGNMMAANGSDFSNVMNRRCMDLACGFVYQALLQKLNDEIPTDPATGFIYEPEATSVDAYVDSYVTNAMAGNVIDIRVRVSRTEPFLSTKRFPVSIGILPYGYAEFITVTIGFINPALSQ